MVTLAERRRQRKRWGEGVGKVGDSMSLSLASHGEAACARHELAREFGRLQGDGRGAEQDVEARRGESSRYGKISDETRHDGMNSRLQNALSLEGKLDERGGQENALGNWKESEQERARRLEVEVLLREKRAQRMLDGMAKGTELKEVCSGCVVYDRPDVHARVFVVVGDGRGGRGGDWHAFNQHVMCACVPVCVRVSVSASVRLSAVE